MEEKVLIKSEQYNVKKLFGIFIVIGVALWLLMSAYFICDHWIYFSERISTHEHNENCYRTRWIGGKAQQILDCWMPEQQEYSNGFVYSMMSYFDEDGNYDVADWLFCLIPVALFALLGVLIYSWLRSYELTVTDKRIFGKVAWGKRVDLPVDSVSATATINHLRGVSVSTSSGRISFLAIKNAAEIYKVISDLLIERQQQKASNVVVESAPKNDVAEELKKFKGLLDAGIITQEDFDAKKAQLLGL